MNYPKEIKTLESEILKRQKRLEKMKQLYWIVILEQWIKSLGKGKS